MKNLTFLSLLLLISLVSSGNETALKATKVIPGQWIKNWLLCGPVPLQLQTDPAKSLDHLPGFETDYLKTSGGETNPAIKPGDRLKTKKGTVKWSLYESPDSVIDLVATLSKSAPVFAYAYSEVEADAPGLWLLGIGTNDGGTLLLNGKQVWDFPAQRGLKIDNNLIPVFLKKGTNTLLLKVEQHGGKWGFCLRFLDFSAEKALQRDDLVRISTDTAGIPSLVSSFPDEILDYILKKMIITVTGSNQEQVMKEERSSSYCRPLKLPTSKYRPCQADLEISLKNGQVLHHRIEFTVGKRTDYPLFSNGKSLYRITLPPDASASEQWTASELQHWLKEISQAEFPVSSFDPAYSGPQIFLGYNPKLAALTRQNKPSDTDESFRYFNEGPDLFICGGNQRGTLYGVFTFLENELGCRWYSSKVSVIPTRNEFKFSWLDHSEKPGVRVRNDFYFEAFEPIWAARNKVNGSMSYREQPGGVESYWAVHTFYPIMPPAEFFQKHPEYYSLIDGKRTTDRAQLCLSNPEVLNIMTERIKDRMRKSPEYLIYDVSQNDWYNPCQCKNCQDLAEKYGGESGVIIWFVNQVAKAVEQEFPGKFIGTLAYQYTRKPPKNITPAQNVVVRLCSIECCFAHDFKSCPQNRSFLEDLQGWSAIAPHLYIWDYVVNFHHYIMPFPNFSVLQPNIKTFRENKAIGIMEQAAYQSRGGEFAELRSYLIARLLWNPEINAEEVISDFMSGYYGRAGKFVRQYFDLLQNLVTPQKHFQYGLAPNDPLYTDDFIKKAAKILHDAEKVADNDEVLHRVEMAELPLLYLKCKRTPVASRLDGSYVKFCRVTEREGITHYAEAGVPHRKAFHAEVESAK